MKLMFLTQGSVSSSDFILTIYFQVPVKCEAMILMRLIQNVILKVL